MSRFNQKPSEGSKLGLVAKELGNQRRSKGSLFSSKDATALMLGMEAFGADDPKMMEVQAHYDRARDELMDAYRMAGYSEVFVASMESLSSPNSPKPPVGSIHLTPAQVESGTIIMMASGDPMAYMAKASQLRPAMESGVTVVDVSPDLAGYDATYSPAMEAFQETELDKHLPFSYVYNTQAARQDDFGEAHFPTIVVTPDQAGLDVSVRLTQIIREYRHDTSGRPAEFGERNLIDAVFDFTLLENNATVVVPYFIQGDAVNNEAFVDVAEIPPRLVTDNGATFQTSVLRAGQRINLLGLSQNPGVMASGQLDNTDPLDHLIRLNTIYVKVHSTASNTDSIIPFDVAHLPLNQYNRPVEGQNRDMLLNYRTSDLVLTYQTQDNSGTAAPALAYLAAPTRQKWIVRLALNVTGNADLERGNVDAAAAPGKIASVWEELGNGDLVEVTDPVQLAALKAELTTFQVIGYDLFASRTNINRRQRGLLVKTQEYKERYTIPLGSPITAQMPVTDTKTGIDLVAPINATRTLNSNKAVTQLIKYGEMLERAKVSMDRRNPVPALEGIGRLLVRPFFERVELRMDEAINSLTSADRNADIQAVLVNQIRNLAYRMRRDAGLQPALDAHTGGTGEKHSLLLGTDTVIEQYLMTTGDTRTFSVGFDHDIVTTQDLRIKDYIYVTFRRKGVTEADPLTFGCMAWIPEMATTLQVTRNNSTVKEVMVQPRVRHINFLPVMGVIHVINLEKVAAQRVDIPVAVS